MKHRPDPQYIVNPGPQPEAKSTALPSSVALSRTTVWLAGEFSAAGKLHTLYSRVTVSPMMSPSSSPPTYQNRHSDSLPGTVIRAATAVASSSALYACCASMTVKVPSPV